MSRRLFGGKRKVFVLGIDGVPCTLLQRMTTAGVMPNLARLIEVGTLCPMSASIPEVSSTSWSTFMTGVNPGRHGIYGFMEVRREDYAWWFPNFGNLRSPTLWEMAGGEGRRSVVVNMPSTYPARPLQGVLIAGFVALDLRKAVFPERIHKFLKDTGYRLDVDSALAASSLKDFAADISQTIAKRMETILHLMANEEWDLFMGTITESDRLHHYLWDALDDESHLQHDFFLTFYRQLDKFIGEIAARLGADIPFIIMSDHGFTGIKSEVYVNAYLREKGYLGFTSARPGSFAEIDDRSSVFALDPARLFIHLKESYPRGSVRREEYAQVREQLGREFSALEYEGSPVIRKVCLREELYAGPCVNAAPDMVLVGHEGYDLKGTLSRAEVFGRSRLTGTHTLDNATFYMNRKFDSLDMNILDASATIARLLGLQLDTLDGRPLL